jgi:hypothetical protein
MSPIVRAGSTGERADRPLIQEHFDALLAAMDGNRDGPDDAINFCIIVSRSFHPWPIPICGCPRDEVLNQTVQRVRAGERCRGVCLWTCAACRSGRILPGLSRTVHFFGEVQDTEDELIDDRRQGPPWTTRVVGIRERKVTP